MNIKSRLQTSANIQIVWIEFPKRRAIYTSSFSTGFLYSWTNIKEWEFKSYPPKLRYASVCTGCGIDAMQTPPKTRVTYSNIWSINCAHRLPKSNFHSIRFTIRAYTMLIPISLYISAYISIEKVINTKPIARRTSSHPSPSS